MGYNTTKILFKYGSNIMQNMVQNIIQISPKYEPKYHQKYELEYSSKYGRATIVCVDITNKTPEGRNATAESVTQGCNPVIYNIYRIYRI